MRTQLESALFPKTAKIFSTAFSSIAVAFETSAEITTQTRNKNLENFIELPHAANADHRLAVSNPELATFS